MRASLAFLLALAFALAPTASSMHAQQAGSHSTSFDHKTGNEWWVEVIVTGSPTRVDARDDGGAWVALEKKSWGAWAKSFHIEPGHRVQFRAGWSDGASVESCWFTHPAGAEECTTTPPPPPPPPTGNFTFAHGGGNEWWVEAKVSPKPVAVEAMDTGGAWKALAFKDWGEWAASFHVEPGHDVKFRARGSDGVWHESCWFTHPSGALRGCTTPTNVTWPREGSYVRYYVDEGDSWPTGSDWYELNITLRFLNGSWQEDVEGWNYLDLYDEEEGLEYVERIRYTAASEGPGFSEPPADANETTFDTRKNGASIDAPALVWGGENDPDCPCGEWHEIAHDGTNLTLAYNRVGRMSHYFITVEDTDAPIAPGDLPRVAPAPPAWPRDGSYASYEVREWYNGSSFPSASHFTITYRYQGGAWTSTCVGTRTEWDVNGTNPQTTPIDMTNDWSWLPAGPLRISSGKPVQVGHPTNCGTHEASWYDDSLVAKSKLKLNVTRLGEPFRASVWYADETDSDQDAGLDYDRWWDLRTGLTLQWEERYDWPWESIGKLTDTDAPLMAG